MKIGPFILQKKRPEDVRCFRLDGLSDREFEDPEIAVRLKDALQDAGVAHLGVSTPENLWCVEDPDGNGKAVEIFERFGFSPREIGSEAGKPFGRWSVAFKPRRQGGRQ